MFIHLEGLEWDTEGLQKVDRMLGSPSEPTTILVFADQDTAYNFSISIDGLPHYNRLTHLSTGKNVKKERCRLNGK